MRTLAVTRRLLRQITRDKRTIGLIFVVPVMVLWLIWAVFASDAYVPKIAGVDLHHSLVGRLEKAGAVVIESEPDAARQGLRDREYDAVIYMADAGPALILDGSDPTVTAAATRVFREAMAGLLTDVVGSEAEIEFLFGDADMTLFDALGPPVIAIIVFFLVFVISGVSFVRERTTGTLERMLATPLRRSEVVLGYALAFLVVAAAQSIVVSLFAVYGLDLLLVGSFGTLVIVVLTLAAASVSLGMLLSAFASNEFQVFQFIPVVIVPQVFFSGLFNLSALPAPLRLLADALPLTHGAEAMREVMLRGSGCDVIWPQLLALWGFIAVMLALNVFALKKYRRI